MKPAFAIPDEVETFIRDIANSFVKIELIKFFHRNLSLLGTIEDMAVTIGRDTRAVKKAMPELVSAGILAFEGDRNAPLWRYAPDDDMSKRIDLFVQFYNTAKGRRATVYRVLEGEV